MQNVPSQITDCWFLSSDPIICCWYMTRRNIYLAMHVGFSMSIKWQLRKIQFALTKYSVRLTEAKVLVVIASAERLRPAQKVLWRKSLNRSESVALTKLLYNAILCKCGLELLSVGFCVRLSSFGVARRAKFGKRRRILAVPFSWISMRRSWHKIIFVLYTTANMKFWKFVCSRKDFAGLNCLVGRFENTLILHHECSCCGNQTLHK